MSKYLSFGADSTEFEQFRYNLALVAPGKGEAKKTVSRGFIRLDLGGNTLVGVATDDILSAEAFITITDGDGSAPAWVTVEALKDAKMVAGTVAIEISEEFDAKFDQLFWEEHVLDSIYGVSGGVMPTGITLSPDRLRKFSLLKPQGSPIRWEFREWADRDIIRWSMGDNLRGVYVPVG